jgi:hypothetical protein
LKIHIKKDQINYLVGDPKLLFPLMGALYISRPNLLGEEGLPREGIFDITAIDPKGILSRRKSPMASNFERVYKKINYRLIRHKVGTVVI